MGGTGTKFKGNESGIEYARPDRGSLEEGYFTKVSATPYVIWCEDNATLYFANEDKSYRKGDTYNGHTITNVWTDIEVYKDETGGDMDYPRWNSDLFADDRIAEKCEKVVFEPNFSAARPERTRGWFAGFSLLTSVDGIENLNTSEVVNMAEMFKDCPKLTSLDLSSFTAIEGIEMDMHEMFSGCYNLTNVDLSNFNSEYVTDMHEMFSGCTRLKTVGLTNFRNTKTWNVAKIFYACMNLTTIYCNYDWNNYPMYVNYDKMFFGCVNLVGGAGTTFKGDESGIGLACPDRGSLDEGYFTTASATPYVIWCESTNTLYFTNPHFDEYAVGDYFGDIDGQTITALWSGDQVTNSGFTPLWFKDETSTSMNQNCKTVVIDKSFQEVKPTSLDLWFAQLDNVEEIQGLQYLNTSEATSMAGMFNSCGIEGGMKTLDVSHFDTGKVTDMQLMFSHCGVTSLDLNSFDVSHVTNFENMFINCSELTTIYCKNDWSAKAPRTAKSTNMFSGCSKLKGSNGTSFSEDHMNIEYARLDAEGTPGYFTFENDEKTYDLTISEAMVGTLYLDFPVVIPNEDYFNVYYVKSIDAEGTLHLKEIYDVIPANTATIIFANAGTYTMMKTDNEGETITGNLLKGVTEATSVADLQAQHGTDIYVLSRGQNSYIGFRIAGGAVKTIPANRAYLPYTSSGNAQELSISFEEDVTGISDIAGHANSGETKIYNLSGQRVKNPQRGIYIVNGKKVYIR